MWKQIYEYTRDFLLLSRDVQETKSDVKEQKTDIREIRAEVKQLRSDFNNLVLLVQKLSFDIQQVSEREQSERREMALKLENEMLKFERRLPSGKNKNHDWHGSNRNHSYCCCGSSFASCWSTCFYCSFCKQKTAK